MYGDMHKYDKVVEAEVDNFKVKESANVYMATNKIFHEI